MTACVAVPTVSAPGRVVDEEGNGVPNATVSLQGTSFSTKTDYDGNFVLQLIDDPPYPVRVTAPGFVRTSYRLAERSHSPLLIMVSHVATATTITLPTTGQAPAHVQVQKGSATADLAIPPNSLVTPSGAVASGNVTVSMTYWTGDRDTSVGVPGPLLAMPDSGLGDPQPLVSVGMADIEITQGNDILQVAAGQYLNFNVTVPPAIKNFMNVQQLHDRTSLYWLNPNTAIWEKVAAIDTPMFQYDAQNGVMQGQLPHLSAWNYDEFGDVYGCVQGRVLDCNGYPLPNANFNAWLMNVEGLKRDTWTTDANGHYCENIPVPTNDPATSGIWNFPIHLSGTDSPDDSNMNKGLITASCVQCVNDGVAESGTADYCYCGTYNYSGSSYCPPEAQGCAYVGQTWSAAYSQEGYNYAGVRSDKLVTLQQGVMCPNAQCDQLPDLMIGTCVGGTSTPPGNPCLLPTALHIGDACEPGQVCCGEDGTPGNLSCLDYLCVPTN